MDENIKPKEKKEYALFEKRRELSTATVMFCMFCIVYIMFSEKVSTIYEAIVDNSFWLLGSVVIAYVFGRTIGDFGGKRSMKSIFGKDKSTDKEIE